MRFKVIFDYLQPSGTKRWIVWDTERRAYADEPRYDRESAEAVCDELNEFGLPD